MHVVAAQCGSTQRQCDRVWGCRSLAQARSDAVGLVQVASGERGAQLILRRHRARSCGAQCADNADDSDDEEPEKYRGNNGAQVCSGPEPTAEEVLRAECAPNPQPLPPALAVRPALLLPAVVAAHARQRLPGCHQQEDRAIWFALPHAPDRVRRGRMPCAACMWRRVCEASGRTRPVGSASRFDVAGQGCSVLSMRACMCTGGSRTRCWHRRACGLRPWLQAASARRPPRRRASLG